MSTFYLWRCSKCCCCELCCYLQRWSILLWTKRGPAVQTLATTTPFYLEIKNNDTRLQNHKIKFNTKKTQNTFYFRAKCKLTATQGFLSFNIFCSFHSEFIRKENITFEDPETNLLMTRRLIFFALERHLNFAQADIPATLFWRSVWLLVCHVTFTAKWVTMQ